MSWPTLETTQFEEFDKLLDQLDSGVPEEQLILTLQRLDTKLEHVENYILAEADFIEPTDVNVAFLNQINDGLESIKPRIEELREHLDDPVAGGEALKKCHATIMQLSRGFAGLRQEAAKEPTYSEVPYIQELFRVTRLVAEERLPKTALEKRLSMFEIQHQQLASTLTRLKFPDKKGGVDPKQEFQSALELQQDAISTLWAYVESEDLSDMEQACLALQNTGSRLLEIQQSLPKGVTATVDEVVGAESANEQTSHLLVLRQAGQAILDGDGDPDRFERILAGQKARMRASRSLFEQLPTLPNDASAGDGQDLNAAKEAMHKGFALVDEGMEILAKFTAAPSQELLQQGTGKIQQGFLAMLGVQNIMERRKAKA